MWWFFFAFVFLGLLVGNLVGMTSAKVTTSLVGLLFAFVGGSVVTFMHKLTDEQRILSAKAVALLAISCLVGLYAGIVVTEYQLLSPPPGVEKDADGKQVTASGQATTREQRAYLRGVLADAADKIAFDYRREIITADHAVSKLLEMIRDPRLFEERSDDGR